MKTIAFPFLVLALSCTTPAAEPDEPMKRIADGTLVTGVTLSEVSQACRAFAVNNAGRFPASLQLLVIPDANGAAYLDGGSWPLLDPWGHPYGYELLESGSRCRIASQGRDGRQGGSGPDEDTVATLVFPAEPAR